MDFERLLQTKRFLDLETIKVLYEEDVIKAPVALRLYFLGQMRLPHGFWKKKVSIAEELGIPGETVKRSCHNLAKEGFIYQDRFNSTVSLTGKTFYRRLWHFGRPENQVEKVRNPPQPDQHLRPKVNLTSDQKRTLKASVETKSEPHTLEEENLEEKLSIEKDPEPGAIDLISSSGSGTPVQTFKEDKIIVTEDELLNRKDKYQYHHHAPADIDENLKDLTYLKTFRLTPKGKDKSYPHWFCSSFKSILNRFGFEGWNTDYEKDTHTIWGFYEKMHSSWMNRWDLIGLMLHYADKMKTKADNGTFVVQDLWMNTFRKRVEPVLSKEKPKNLHWPESVVRRLRIMQIEEDAPGCL